MTSRVRGAADNHRCPRGGGGGAHPGTAARGGHALVQTGAGQAGGDLADQRDRIWRAFGLQPWRTEDFKISPDPLLIDKIRDVIGLYLAPQANAAVFAVDEKPPGSRSPPCAHHDPLCAMQTREWTSTRTIQNNWAGIRASGRPTAIAERDDHGVGARAGSDARSIAESERVLPCCPDRSADARSDGHVLGPGGLATGSGWSRRKPASALSSRLP